MSYFASALTSARCCSKALAMAAGLWLAAPAFAEDPIGIRVPEGFTVTAYANDSLAHDIFSMTVDALGRVVVSGPGYVKILIDTDNDGKADKAQTFVELASGAQGLYFLGRDLMCTADQGLVRYRDANNDDKADGPPEVFLKIHTGGEHHAHAIRRGPDGWWYLIAGNMSGVNAGYATLPTSPIKSPHAGVILRLKPDLSGGEILADGFRNAYDFDFNAQGELFAYDSDGERDISLPWYLPTRLFHVLPAGEHGWMTESCKRPDHFLDAAPVVASTGRGSPTGVACYRHTQFPEEYRNGLFILDWTFGRVFFVPGTRDGETWSGKPQNFITAQGQFGFAPTDAAIGADGSLFVCVGGRGTHGTVYRITYTGKPGAPAPKPEPLPPLDPSATADVLLSACLDAPQPLSSWSRARWVPAALKLGAQPFLSASLDDRRPVAARVRAIEILTDLYNGLPGTAVELLRSARDPEVRARAVWSVGMKQQDSSSLRFVAAYLEDTDPLVRRCALEALAASHTDLTMFAAPIGRCMNDDRKFVRNAAARLVPMMTMDCFRQVSEVARHSGWRAALTNALGFTWRTQTEGKAVNLYAADIGRRILDGKHDNAMKRDAARLIQIALGDMVPNGKTPAVFDSYIGSTSLTKYSNELEPLRASLLKVFPTGDRLTDIELTRVMSILTPTSTELVDKVLAQVTATSNPIDDIHFLIVASRLPGKRTASQQTQTAEALLNLDDKLRENGLQQDNNWIDRMNEVFTKLVELDSELPTALCKSPRFGRPSHVVFLPKIPDDQLKTAIDAFAREVARDPTYPWNNDVVFTFGMSADPKHQEIVRQQFEKFELRTAVLLVLSEDPQEQDREKFIAGLDSSYLEVLTGCVTALEKLPESKSPTEFGELVKLLRRLGAEKSEYPLREQVVKLLQRNSGEEFPFQFGFAGYHPQTEAVQRWTQWLEKTYPEEAARVSGNSDIDLGEFKKLLAGVDWKTGDAQHGKKLFVSRGCAQCHNGSAGLGPDLAGATGRFSRDDLFVAIAAPNRDVSPRYQTILVETKQGKTYTGLVVYESVDGVLLRNGTNQTFRIQAADIESKRSLPTSIMPTGLLKELQPEELAHLYRFLEELNVKTADKSTARTE